MAKPLRVLAFTIGPEVEPSSRYRVYQWQEPLARRGIELEIRPLASEAWFELGFGIRETGAAERTARTAGHFAARLGRRLRDLHAARRFDLLWLQKELLPFGLAGVAVRLGVPFVWDVDDAIWEREPGDGALRRLADRTLRSPAALARFLPRAARVLAGSPVLASALARWSDRVEVLPTVVDAALHARAARAARAERSEAPLRVGWFGAPSGAGALASLRPVLAELAGEHGFTLELHGIDAYACPGVAVTCHPFRRYASRAEEAAAVARFDIALMPLAETPRAAGKCGLKAIQAMACGTPVVASPVGAAREVVGPGGLLARRARDWHAALGTLLGDASLRARLGRAGRAYVAAHYSIAAQAPRLERWLREAAAQRTVGKRMRSARSTSSSAASIESVPRFTPTS